MTLAPPPADDTAWPALPYAAWKETGETLGLWTQIVGKVRLARTPWLNHSWHVPLYVTARGLGTGPIAHGGQSFDMEFDFIDQTLRVRTSAGGMKTVRLEPMSVATFHDRVMRSLADLGVPVAIDGAPNEIADAIPFRQDRRPRDYDPDYARRFWRILIQADRLLGLFRTAFLGKCSPVHFFWGSFDLAVTRFSGRAAPPHPGGVPHLPDAVVRDAYSHEVSGAGFWPGGGGVDYPAFYSYAYPEPPGFRAAPIAPPGAFYSTGLGEYLLPYEVARMAADPDQAVLSFLTSAYAAAADNAAWDRAALECDLGRPGVVRPT
ncbi:MAG: DUF5996 family protein [Caulobacteraceae bacterium]